MFAALVNAPCPPGQQSRHEHHDRYPPAQTAAHRSTPPAMPATITLRKSLLAGQDCRRRTKRSVRRRRRHRNDGQAGRNSAQTAADTADKAASAHCCSAMPTIKASAEQ
ncbi:hypothetical protein M8494_04430 [Serratia ureilytica]